MTPKYFLGMISGTSCDGIDTALIGFEGDRLVAMGALSLAYPETLRDRLLEASTICIPSARELGSLDVAVGDAFSKAAIRLIETYDIPRHRVRAIGSHGQTVLHAPQLGFSIQIGDPSLIAQRTGITTVADFRRADIAAGGQGAPLAPAFHQYLFTGDTPVAVLNLGGIANLTLIDPHQKLIAFDVGPANTLIDGLMRERYNLAYDTDGSFAAGGTVSGKLLEELLSDVWFRQGPPKSTGTDYFNLQWLHRHSQISGMDGPDVAATLIELTAASISLALPSPPPVMYCCGGGVHNHFLMARIQANLERTRVVSTRDIGYDPDYIEAMCFAWLARERLENRAAGIPSVTGALHPATLGAIYAA